LALVFGFLVLIEKPWFLRFEIYNRDNIGLEKICSLKKEESDEDLKSLKRQIRLEAKETHERSNSARNQLDYIKISKRTVGRYTKMVDNVQVTK
jgi:hypothetical protein